MKGAALEKRRSKEGTTKQKLKRTTEKTEDLAMFFLKKDGPRKKS